MRIRNIFALLFVGLISSSVLANGEAAVTFDISVRATESYVVDMSGDTIKLIQDGAHQENFVYVAEGTLDGADHLYIETPQGGLMLGRSDQLGVSSMDIDLGGVENKVERRDSFDQKIYFSSAWFPLHISEDATGYQVKESDWLPYVADHLAPAAMAAAVGHANLEALLVPAWEKSLLITGGSPLDCVVTSAEMMECEFDYAASIDLP